MATEQGYLELQRSPEEDNKESWRWLARLWVGERRRGAGKVSLLFICEVLGEKCTENKGLERPMM